MKTARIQPELAYSDWKTRFPGKEPEPVIGFLYLQLEDLTDDYKITPMDELFRCAIDKLGVKFKHASMHLPRSKSNPLFQGIVPPSLLFLAYNGEWGEPSKEKPVPRVSYSRNIFRSLVHFDTLDTGEESIDDVVKNITAKEPEGGRVEIITADMTLSLRTGYDYLGDHFDAMARHEARMSYSYTSQRLTIGLNNAPWLTGNGIRPEINVDVKDKKPEEVVELAKKIFTDYVSHSQ